MRHEKEMREAVESTLYDLFADLEVQDIKFQDDIDEDDDPIVKIYIIFQGKLEESYNPNMSKLTRSVWSQLTKLNEPRFPIVSFIPNSEYRIMSSESN